MFIDLSGWQLAGPLHHERHAQAALIHTAFALAQGGVAGGEFAGGTAVVAQENDEGIFLQTLLAQFSQYGAHTVIKVREHGGEDAALDVFNVLELFHVRISALQRAVHGVVGKVE